MQESIKTLIRSFSMETMNIETSNISANLNPADIYKKTKYI